MTNRTYRPYARPDDITPPCYEDMTPAHTDRSWHDVPGDINLLMEELRLSAAHRARTNTLIDISPWAFFARL